MSFNSGFNKNGILIGVENGSLMYSDTLGRSLIEAQYPIKFTKQQNKFCLEYNGNDSFQCSKNWSIQAKRFWKGFTADSVEKLVYIDMWVISQLIMIVLTLVRFCIFIII